MKPKCLSCRHYGNHFTNFTDPAPGVFASGWCSAPEINAQVESAGYILARGSSVDIATARDLCDREGNGIFVHFEPEDPATGAAFAGPQAASLPEHTLKAAA